MDVQRTSDESSRAFLARTASRRGLLKGFVAVMTVGAVAPLAAACGPQSPAPSKPATEAKPGATQPAAAAKPATEAKPAAAQPAAGEPKKGGTLKIAILGEPPALDSMFTTATVVADTTWHIMETLYSRTGKQEPVPHLVEKYDASSDGKKVELTLRKNVLFHNDKEMTSADVVASLKRMIDLAPRMKTVLGRAEKIDAKDKYTVTLDFKEPTAGVLPYFLYLRDAIIMPAEIAEQFPKAKFDQPIGTGPYKFVEHLPDRHVRMQRWDKYTPVEKEPAGPSGRRVAYLDELYFIPVPEESVRTDGVGTNEYHYADSLSPDMFDKVKGYPDVSADIGKPYYWCVAHFNKKESMFTNLKLRQAVLTATNVEPIARSAFGRPDFFRLGPEIAGPETVWYTDEGKDVFNKPDPAKAKALLQEAGYDGTPVRWMSTKEYFYNYNGALAFKQQLEEIGMKIDLQVMDWATLVKRRSDSKEWDIFITGHTIYNHPLLQPFLGSGWPGWWANEEKDKAVASLMAESDPKKALEMITQIQKLVYTDVPFVKYGEYFVLRARSNKVQGMVNDPEPYFWNTWLS